MNYIELTSTDGNPVTGNINLLKRVFVDTNGNTCISGWNNNGYIEVKESYEEVISMLNARIAGVYRKKPQTV